MSISTALKARSETLRNREDGFTLIELLVVVIIIGILAAIAIPVYAGIQNSSKEAAVKSDLGNVKTAVVAWATDNTTATAAPTLDATTLSKYGFTLSGEYTTAPNYKTGSTPTNFCIDSKAKATGGTWYVSTNKNVTTGTCSATTTDW